MASFTDPTGFNLQPVCQNCQTSTTPLWRRDEIGSVLCNACGLFLKLHGSPRPISLKTDVIKSRNRVKSSQQAQKKKSLFEANGHAVNHSEAPHSTPSHQQTTHRRTSQKASPGNSNRSNSPISRTVTPAINQPSNIAPQHIFDGISLPTHDSNSPSLPSLNLRHLSPGSTSSLNDRHLEPPQSYEGLQQAYANLKTRVSELDVINGLYRSEIDQLSHYRQLYEQSQQKENDLKRRVDELENEIDELRGGPGPRAKRPRLSDQTPEYPEPPQAIMS